MEREVIEVAQEAIQREDVVVGLDDIASDEELLRLSPALQGKSSMVIYFSDSEDLFRDKEGDEEGEGGKDEETPALTNDLKAKSD